MQGGFKYHFWVFGMTQPRIETRSPGEHSNHLTNAINLNDLILEY